MAGRLKRSIGAADEEAARDEVRAVAQRQHAALKGIEVETLPGTGLGHRNIAVNAVSCDVPGGTIEYGTAGAIVHVASQVVHVGGARRSVLCASKSAMEALACAMATDPAPHGIRVNTLCPSFIETPLTRPVFEDAAFRAEVLPKIRLGRLGQVEDLMGAIILPCSDAAALMAGSSLMVDGGWTEE
jgi:NAD(P)-dependent dehydrogenase (short-subunit alcohol dehydrogenase family)